jgi:hypothetical protein
VGRRSTTPSEAEVHRLAAVTSSRAEQIAERLRSVSARHVVWAVRDHSMINTA